MVLNFVRSMPGSAAELPRIFRFGLYELDVRAGELRKSGLKIKLQGQPLQILKLLLEQPGEVITREALRNQLWRAGTFVDFDHSLNTAVKRLREALDDSADNPRFIETLPRCGYRFIGAVDRKQYLAHSISDSKEHFEWSRVNVFRIGLGVSAVIALFILAAAGSFYFHWTRKVTTKETVVSAHFNNTMGGAASDAGGVLKTVVSSSLASTRIQNILPGDVPRRVRHAEAPVYPEAAMRAHVTGTVEIGVGISPQGDVENYSVLSGPAMLTPAAVEAIRKWKFQPNVVQGEPTWSRTRALVRFGGDGITAVAFAHPILADSFGDPGTQRDEPREAAIPAIVQRANSSPEVLQKRHQRQVELARRSAEAGDPWGQTLLGIYYQGGVGVEKDANQALEWFTKAANQDFADAQYHLGRMYESGQGTPQDYGAAVAWYRKAADHASLLDGPMGSRRRLARLYLLGLGVPQDYVQADILVRIAGADPLAHRIHSAEDAGLLKVEAKMTPVQIAEAQRRADEWIAQHKNH